MAATPTTPWFAATMGLAGLIVGYAVANGMNGVNLALPNFPSNNPPAAGDTIPPPPPSNAEPADADDDPVMGQADAPITIIEFTDYQCPFCGRHFEQTYGKIKTEYVDTGKVKYVLRDYPLSFHPHAQKASEATECADDQGKFWEMHDKLFQAQATWSQAADAIPSFKQFAQELGLDTRDFDSCLDGGTHADEVQADFAAGSAAGIDGTPGFWILGPDDQKQQISGAYPFDSFKTAFDGMLD